MSFSNGFGRKFKIEMCYKSYSFSKKNLLETKFKK